MRHQTIPLGFDTPGSSTVLDAFIFGSDNSNGPAAYLQAGLHANEVPGVLVLQYLMKALTAAENNGELTGKVTVVPAANPIGLRQFIQGQHHGRFDLGSGENFNRRFVAFSDEVCRRLRSEEKENSRDFARVVKNSIQQVLGEAKPATQLAALRIALTRLASDADTILDLHCDREACLHLYANEHQLDDAQLLASHVGADVVLYAPEQGGASFDDSIVTQWLDIYRRFQRPLETAPVFAATIELRGRTDIDRQIASHDAARLLAYLTARGVVKGTPAIPATRPSCVAPLSGVEVLQSPAAGLLLYHQEIGANIAPGDLVAEIIHPVSGEVHELRSNIEGCFFARDHERYVSAGHNVSFVSGVVPLDKGQLLTA